jgi:hypothetical protein
MTARPRGVFRVAMVLALTLGAVPSAWGSTGGIRVEPFAADGSLAAGWSTTAKVSGSCFTGAIATQRSDAFRCFAGASTLVDPCFSSPAGKAEVLCVLAPWSRAAIEIRLTKPLPAAGHGPGRVWAVELANGGRCNVSTGANGVSHGRVVGWYCTNGALAEQLHPAATWWSWWQRKGGGQWKRVKIRTVYR